MMTKNTAGDQIRWGSNTTPRMTTMVGGAIKEKKKCFTLKTPYTFNVAFCYSAMGCPRYNGLETVLFLN